MFSRLLVDLGFEAAVFDHYASQTWVLSDFFAESLRRQLIHIGITRMEPIDHWLNSYMLRILRKPLIADGMPDISQSLLWKAFRAPVDVAALTDVKLSTVSGVQDLDSWSETPKKLIPNNTELSNGNRLLWETMAMWLTAPGLRLPQPCREYLLSVALRYPETQADEFELRRPLLVTDN
ncbi:MAG: hypothetical protein HY547_03335 [Elusimicrobia bacterium]|nr:hypothetical protein [Elusimicrobiota bacterium]